MRKMNRYFSALLLAAAIAAPTVALAAPAPAAAPQIVVRVYDRDHRDYHNWNDHEEIVYRRYLVEQHRGYREYRRQHRSVQRGYWNYRHSHPDY